MDYLHVQADKPCYNYYLTHSGIGFERVKTSNETREEDVEGSLLRVNTMPCASKPVQEVKTIFVSYRSAVSCNDIVITFIK